MDEVKLQKLSKRVRLLNVLLVMNALIFIIGFAATAAVGYLAVQELRKTNTQLGSIHQDVSGTGGSSSSAADLQDELCNSSGTLKTLISSQTDVCN